LVKELRTTSSAGSILRRHLYPRTEKKSGSKTEDRIDQDRAY